MLVETLIEQAAACKASDLHIAYGVPPKVRRDGELQDLEGFAPLTDQDCETVAQELLGESMPALGERDLSLEVAGRRIRVNLFRQSGHVSAAVRAVSMVMRSRISPMRMTSGSSRRMARRPSA